MRGECETASGEDCSWLWACVRASDDLELTNAQRSWETGHGCRIGAVWRGNRCQSVARRARGDGPRHRSDPAEKLASSVAQLDGLPITFHLGEHRVEDFVDTDLIVTSPAVAPHNEFLQHAVAANIPITTEICLFVERCPAPIVGITGTKGEKHHDRPARPHA